MSKKLPLLAVAAFAFGLQFGLPVAHADIDPIDPKPLYKCARTTVCTDAFPDQPDVDCVTGTLPECKVWSDHNGCLHCSAST